MQHTASYSSTLLAVPKKEDVMERDAGQSNSWFACHAISLLVYGMAHIQEDRNSETCWIQQSHTRQKLYPCRASSSAWVGTHMGSWLTDEIECFPSLSRVLCWHRPYSCSVLYWLVFSAFSLMPWMGNIRFQKLPVSSPHATDDHTAMPTWEFLNDRRMPWSTIANGQLFAPNWGHRNLVLSMQLCMLFIRSLN